jgi:outer membrane PBP1 activator LpoA protein
MCVQSYVDFLPLADIADETGKSQQSDKAEQFGQTQYPQRPASMQDLEALAEVLQLKCAVMQRLSH